MGQSQNRDGRMPFFVTIYAIIFFVAYLSSSLPTNIIIISLILMVILAIVSGIDWRTQIIPDVFSLGLLVAGLVTIGFLNKSLLIWHIVAALLGLIFFVAISFGYYKITGRYALGLGDAKLFGAAGAWVGLAGLPSVLLWATLSALFTVLIMSWFSDTFSRKDRIAFGPFLAFGLWIVWLFGPLQ